LAVHDLSETRQISQARDLVRAGNNLGLDVDHVGTSAPQASEITKFRAARKTSVGGRSKRSSRSFASSSERASRCRKRRAYKSRSSPCGSTDSSNETASVVTLGNLSSLRDRGHIVGDDVCLLLSDSRIRRASSETSRRANGSCSSSVYNAGLAKVFTGLSKSDSSDSENDDKLEHYCYDDDDGLKENEIEEKRSEN